MSGQARLSVRQSPLVRAIFVSVERSLRGTSCRRENRAIPSQAGLFSDQESSAPGCTYSWLSRDSADRLGGCRQPEVLGEHCRGLVLNRNDGSVRCGGLQAFSDRGPPHRWGADALVGE
jgi:hypothetical protein